MTNTEDYYGEYQLFTYTIKTLRDNQYAVALTPPPPLMGTQVLPTRTFDSLESCEEETIKFIDYLIAKWQVRLIEDSQETEWGLRSASVGCRDPIMCRFGINAEERGQYNQRRWPAQLDRTIFSEYLKLVRLPNGKPRIEADNLGKLEQLY